MKFRPWAAGLLWFMVLGASTAAPARDVYFSGKDGSGGSGAATDPWQGTSAANLDARLRPLWKSGANDLRIFFAAGEFECWGAGDSNADDGTAEKTSTYGFRLRKGWKLIGAGRGKTRFKLTPKPGAPTREFAAFFSLQDAPDVEIRELSLDCNWAAFRADANCKGVSGIGGRLNSGLVIERVEITGHGCRAIDWGGAIYAYSICRKAKGLRVRDCWIHAPEPNEGANAHLIALGTNNHHTATPKEATAECLVEDNLLQGPGAIALGIQSGGIVVRNNRVENCTYGIYCDTGFLYDNLYENNHITGTHYSIKFLSGWFHEKLGQPAVRHCIFRKNVIEVTATGEGFAASAANGAVNFEQNLIAGNTVRYTAGSVGNRPGLVIDKGTHNSGNVVRNNAVSPELITSTP
jgi:hypothetical protein